MRTSTVATTLVAVTAGLTAVTALHRRSGRRPTAPALTAPALTAPAPPATDQVADEGQGDGVVLPFVRPVPAPAAVVPEPSTAPARCGDSGGRTKAGAPCAARATAAGRCHHHRQAA